MRRFSRQRSVLLAGSVFTCLVFRSNGLAAPPVTYSYPPVTSRIPVPLVTAIPGPNPTRFNSRSAYGGGARQWAFADFNRDGRIGILVAPTFVLETVPSFPLRSGCSSRMGPSSTERAMSLRARFLSRGPQPPW